MPTFSAELLKKVVINVLIAAGTKKDEAKIVAEHLITANLYGHDSHGIIHLPRYTRMVLEGRIKLGAKMRVVKETQSTALMDADWGFGQVMAKKGMKMAIEKAKTTGIGLVAMHNLNHTGRIGTYPEMALEHNMIGVTLGGGGKFKAVTVFGGSSPLLGTNPISIAIPTFKEKPILLDMATSEVAGGKIRLALARGENVPLGWIINSEGKPTTDPSDHRKGGALLPFGRYKGSSLGIIVQILGGLLAGMGVTYGFILMALDISALRPPENFKENVDEFIRTIKTSRTAPGIKEILIAGEPELNTMEKRLKEGIFIEEKTWKEIETIAKELKLDLKKLIAN
ncbi:Ldh family oxidoreductase [Candidatus Bathyarchaeota archaeon]|nr:Ldh family oxidoreductase [Candidatus Bathyarchaeota archaeon]